MKTLAIDGIIKGFDDKPVVGDSLKPVTSKDILIQTIGVFFTSPDASENIQAYSIGQKLYAAEGSMELEDADFKLLKKAFDKVVKDQRYSVTVIAHIHQLLESVE